VCICGIWCIWCIIVSIIVIHCTLYYDHRWVGVCVYVCMCVICVCVCVWSKDVTSKRSHIDWRSLSDKSPQSASILLKLQSTLDSATPPIAGTTLATVLTTVNMNGGDKASHSACILPNAYKLLATSGPLSPPLCRVNTVGD
jgi:hypothetical protein